MSCFNPLRPYRSCAALLALAFLLAACQPLSRPFAPDEAERGGNTGLLKLPGGGGVLVLPLAGTSEKTSAVLVAAMIKALHELNIPAATSGRNRRSYTLQGWLGNRALDGGMTEVEIVWDLLDGAGRAAGNRKLRWRMADKRWRGAGATVLKVIAGESAASVAAMIQAPQPPAPAPPRTKPPRTAAAGLPPV